MPDPLCAFVGQGAALTAAAWAAAAANADGGGPFQRLGEGRGAALREAWTAEAVHTVPRKGGRRRATPTSCSCTPVRSMYNDNVCMLIGREQGREVMMSHLSGRQGSRALLPRATRSWQPRLAWPSRLDGVLL